MHWGFAACFLLEKKKRPSLIHVSTPKGSGEFGERRAWVSSVCLYLDLGRLYDPSLVSARAQGIDKISDRVNYPVVYEDSASTCRYSVFITNKGPSMEILRFESTRRAIRF